MITQHIQGGPKEKIGPGDVLSALTVDLGYTREQVAGQLNNSRNKGKTVKVHVLTD